MGFTYNFKPLCFGDDYEENNKICDGCEWWLECEEYTSSVSNEAVNQFYDKIINNFEED